MFYHIIEDSKLAPPNSTKHRKKVVPVGPMIVDLLSGRTTQ